jgi:anti-sigma B factor antagonist
VAVRILTVDRGFGKIVALDLRLRQGVLSEWGDRMAVGEVVIERDGDVWVVTLRGEHDVSTDPSLADALRQAFGGGSKVVVDLSDVEFIDSSVLRALAYGRKEAVEHAEHELVVVAPSGTFVSRILRLTRIDTMIRVYETRTDALAAI